MGSRTAWYIAEPADLANDPDPDPDPEEKSKPRVSGAFLITERGFPY
jgi:hypothetical protein